MTDRWDELERVLNGYAKVCLIPGLDKTNCEDLLDLIRHARAGKIIMEHLRTAKGMVDVEVAIALYDLATREQGNG